MKLIFQHRCLWGKWGWRELGFCLCQCKEGRIGIETGTCGNKQLLEKQLDKASDCGNKSLHYGFTRWQLAGNTCRGLRRSLALHSRQTACYISNDLAGNLGCREDETVESSCCLPASFSREAFQLLCWGLSARRPRRIWLRTKIRHAYNHRWLERRSRKWSPTKCRWKRCPKWTRGRTGSVKPTISFLQIQVSSN